MPTHLDLVGRVVNLGQLLGKVLSVLRLLDDLDQEALQVGAERRPLILLLGRLGRVTRLEEKGHDNYR